MVPYPFRELGTPVVREYQKTLGGADERGFSFNSMEGYLNAKLVVAALQKTPPPLTRARLMATMKTMNEDLGGYPIAFAKQNNQGSHFVVLTMVRKDGSFAR